MDLTSGKGVSCFTFIIFISVFCTFLSAVDLKTYEDKNENDDDLLWSRRLDHFRTRNVRFDDENRTAGKNKNSKPQEWHHVSSVKKSHRSHHGKNHHRSNKYPSPNHHQKDFNLFTLDNAHRMKRHHKSRNVGKRSLNPSSQIQSSSRIATSASTIRSHMIFEYPEYQSPEIPEDVHNGTPLLDVTLLSKPESSSLEMSTDNDLFMAKWTGGNSVSVVTNGRLDADDNRGQYSFKISAKIAGTEETATATMRVSTRNTNDEAPRFTQDIYASSVDETAKPGALVATVVATDKDGDKVKYAFASGYLVHDLFTIGDEDGVIQLRTYSDGRDPEFKEDKYDLNVRAVDDGSCCVGGNATIHTSTTLVVVSIIDVNDHKPEFENCNSLDASVLENRPSGTFVIQMTATDKDRGENKEVVYSVVQQPNQRDSNFVIDKNTGEVTTNKQFDREGDDGKMIYVTIKATDKGTPPLDGLCTLKVHILDENDNAPEFERQFYGESIPHTKKVNDDLFNILATDKDSGVNAVVKYSIERKGNSDDADYFTINADSGRISLRQILTRTKFSFVVVAKDQGEPQRSSEVEVTVTVVQDNNMAPQWQELSNAPIEVSENTTVDTEIAVLYATSDTSNSEVVYKLMEGNSEQTNKNTIFRMSPGTRNGNNAAIIKLNRPLDYETFTDYNITIRAENGGRISLVNETTLYIKVIDVNDEIPFFIQIEKPTIFEDENIGTSVVKIIAHDKDGTVPFNTVFYKLISGNDKFEIDRISGEVKSKVRFDREQQAQHSMRVEVEDGAPSARPNQPSGFPNSHIQDFIIDIGDKNDNEPIFSQQLYEANVKENENILHIVVIVTATDLDASSRLLYRITSGNGNGAFGIREDTGAIFVAGSIDYETKKEYDLTVVVSDGLYTAETKVKITVEDVNDLPPKFDQLKYETNVTEEDKTNLPKIILKVRAVDGDTERPNDIIYYLSGQGTENPKYFSIDSRSGEISVLEPLDRDLPHGRPIWRFTVHAADEGGGPGSLTNYAEVQVRLIDINDNSPFFSESSYVGMVEENRALAGDTALQMLATDYDDPEQDGNAVMSYKIIQNAHINGEEIFDIDVKDATIKTAVCCLDRETVDHYVIVIVAEDGGGRSGTGTATINVKDVNDSPPRFDQRIYSIEIPETNGNIVKRDEPILVVQVLDDDLPETNKNYFIIEQNSGAGWEKFNITANGFHEGFLKVAKPLDYENPVDKKGFKFTIVVDDTGGLSNKSEHVDTAEVHITLLDINDNAPEFDQYQVNASVYEDAPTGYTVATFTAKDIDNDGKSVVRYEIERSTNRRRHFGIDGVTGIVVVQRQLDRERTDHHVVHILAIDDGIPAKTSTATLYVTVLDINDNPPDFCEPYRGLVKENSPGPFPMSVFDADKKTPLVIHACDPDDENAGNGPPFKFELDSTASAEIKETFRVEYNSGGQGTAEVKVLRTLDREEQKDYKVPIVISDGGDKPQTGTSTLTVFVGDVNDNEMTDGTTDILVYVFKGRSSANVVIGRVYATDLDDDDWADKKFSWIVPGNENFELNVSSGHITMLKGTRQGRYMLRMQIEDVVRAEIAVSIVTVNVKSIPEEAVFKSGSIRIKGMSEEDFISIWDYKSKKVVSSKRDQLRKKIAEILDIPEGNVEVFTVKQSNRAGMLDVRFSAHGSPYYKPEKLNGLLNKRKSEIEDELGITIEMIGIDECLYELKNCESSCTNELVVHDVPYMITTKQTGLVGIDAFVKSNCVCAARESFPHEQCKADSCYNGGKCKLEHNGIKCECLHGFSGPKCQQTTRSFLGNGYAWFSPLPMCENSHLSLEFMTKSPNGLLFYNGPISEPDPHASQLVQDFISLELREAKPRLLIDYGSGTLELEINSKSLDDGQWHKIDIFWEPERVTLIVDMCADIASLVQDGHQLKDERDICEAKGTPPNFNEFLNVNMPLQLGGVGHERLEKYDWAYEPTREGFNGCVKNLIHNSDMYDLQTPGFQSSSPSTQFGCPQMDDVCKMNEINPPCVNGICVSSLADTNVKCLCNPGFSGTYCDKETVPTMFKNDSVVTYKLLSRVATGANQFLTEIQFRFRCDLASPDGELMFVQGENSEYMLVEIREQRLRFRFNLKDQKPVDEKIVYLSSFEANDGYWHTVKITRFGSNAFLSVDDRGGKFYNETVGSGDIYQLMTIPDDGITLGGRKDYYREVWTDFKRGCLDDLRFDRFDHHLPMPPTELKSDYANVENFTNVEAGCDPQSCLKADCPLDTMDCEDLFWDFACICKPGFVLNEKNICIDINECEDDYDLCLNGGTCLNLIGGFECHCLEGFTGTYCHVVHEKHEVKLSMGALAAILVSFLAILLLVLLLIIYTRNRRTNYGLVDPDEDIRENIINYNDEGGGEDDMHTYDIGPLRIPIDSSGMPISNAKPGPEKPMREPVQNLGYSPDGPNVGEFINNNLGKADDDPESLPLDDLRVYAYEGGGSDAGSLSSLASGTDDNEQDFDYLNGWGPRFQKLADMYGQGESEDDE